VATAKPLAGVVIQRIYIMNIAHIRSRFFVAVLFFTMFAFGNTVSAQTVDSSDPQILI
jgi:phospholipid transport system substrate-binding protein